MRAIAKAIVAGGTTFGGGLVTALADGQITTVEWVIVAVASVVAAAAVWATPNGTSGQ